MASLDELEDVFAIDSPQNVSSFFSYLPSEGSSNKGASNAAIQFHYDVGNPFYKIWLDEQLVYSAARWTDPITSEVLATTLEQAQQEKILFHLRAVKAKPEDSILDIGCGWGAILQSAVSNFGVRKATGLTLSKEQAIMISENCSGKVDVQLVSYENFASEELYDGVISVGAFEHFVKPEMNAQERIDTYRTFFKIVSRNLKKGGRLSLQTICWNQIDGSTAKRIVPVDVFPESDLPYISEIFQSSNMIFTPIYMENNSTDYTSTLEIWLKRMRAGKNAIVSLHGLDHYTFFENYLRNSIIGFKKNRTSLGRFVFQKN
jgi:cyclopropane-fatty-acyl-phospholipid synthase